MALEITQTASGLHVISDIDNTITKPLDGSVDFVNSDFGRDIKRDTLKFIGDHFFADPETALKMYDELREKYRFVAFGLEQEYQIPRDDFYREVWNKNPADYLEADRELKFVLENLRGRLALLTAAPTIWATRVIEHLGLTELVGDWVYTGQGVHAKPSPKAFIQIIERFGIQPDQGVSMGDNKINEIDPANKVGLWTVHIAPEPAKLEENEQPADFTAPNVYYALQLLESEGLITFADSSAS